MQLLPSPEQGRFLAVVLLLIALVAGYYVCVHWWFTTPHFEFAEQIADLKEQELKLREKAAERVLFEKQLADVEQYESSNPAFLPEADFEAAAAGLNQRLKQVVASHVTDATRCQIIMNQNAHAAEPERFERVTTKVRLRCDLEQFAGILYDLESASPMLFIEDLQVFRQQGYSQAGRNKATGDLDIRFDLYGYIRKKIEASDKNSKARSKATP